MVFDKESHRKIFLELINTASWKGNNLEIGMEIKQAVKNAEVHIEDTEKK